MRLLAGDRVYIDANIFIKAAEGSEPSCQDLLLAVQRGQVLATTSELMNAEVLVGALKQNRVDLVAIYERLFGPESPLDVTPADRDLLRQAAYVQALAGGRLPDAIHVATALAGACRCLVTSDVNLRTTSSMPLLLLPDLAAAL